MATGRGFQGFEEKLDTGASWPDRMIRLSSLGPGARRTLGESDQGAVSPQTGRRHLGPDPAQEAGADAMALAGPS